MVMCCVAKKVMRNTHVLFMQMEKLLISTSHNSKTTEPISTKFIYIVCPTYTFPYMPNLTEITQQFLRYALLKIVQFS